MTSGAEAGRRDQRGEGSAFAALSAAYDAANPYALIVIAAIAALVAAFIYLWNN